MPHYEGTPARFTANGQRPVVVVVVVDTSAADGSPANSTLAREKDAFPIIPETRVSFNSFYTLSRREATPFAFLA